MSSDVQPVDAGQEISFADIVQFVKKYFGNIAVFAVLSLLIAAFFIAAAYLLLPRKELYVSKINLQLQELNNKLVYPSEKEFSANDVISIPVLRKVYEDNKLSDRIKFEDFCQLFSLTGRNIEKALIDASFRGKLADKKISAIDLKNLEREYREALRNLDSNMIEIAMEPTLKFNSHEVVRILNDIPAAWFAIFSKQEAKVLPRIETVAQIKALRSLPASEGWLIALDKARVSCRNLQKGCEEIGEILAGQKVSLASGEYLEDLQERLAALEKLRIRTVLMLVLDSPAYQSDLDRIFLRSNIMEIDRQIDIANAKYDAAVAAINILHPNDANQGKAAAVSADKAASMTMNFDSSFFSSVSALIRDAQSIKIREEYAKEALKHKELLAELNAEKKYYSSMLEQLESKKNGSAKIAADQFNKIGTVMFDELTALSAKVNELRDLVFRDYLMDRQFFATDGEVLKNSQFYIPFVRIAAGVIALVAILNIVFIGYKFYNSFTSGELKK